MEFGDSALQSFAVGDLVTIDTAGGNAPLRVVGIARTSGLNPAVTGKAVGYMSQAGLLQLPAYTYVPGQVPHQPLRAQEIAIKLHSPADYQAAADVIGPLVRAHGANVLAVFPPEHGVPLQQLRGTFSLVRVLIAVALLLASMLLLNTITALVTEQTAVIGTMKALSAARARVVRGYLSTVAIYSAVATPVGVAVGVGVGRYLTMRLAASIPLATGPFELSPAVIGIGVAVGFGVPLLAALLPLWLGTRVSVRDALAAWGVARVPVARTGTVTRLLAGRLGWVPQIVWLALRGLLRRPWRAALSIATVATAAGCFLVVQSMAASVSGSIAALWGQPRRRRGGLRGRERLLQPGHRRARVGTQHRHGRAGRVAGCANRLGQGRGLGGRAEQPALPPPADQRALVHRTGHQRGSPRRPAGRPRRPAADGRDGPIAEVFTFNDEVVRHQRNFTPLYALLVAVAVVVAAVGVLGLADALGTSVVERQKDIGLLRALGAGGRQVATVFWIEGLALSVVAWLLASLTGVPLAYLFVGLFQRLVMPVTFHFDPSAFAVMLAATLAVATLASVAPALRGLAARRGPAAPPVIPANEKG